MTAPDFTGWREPWPLTPTPHQLAEPKSVVVEMNRALPLAKNAQRPGELVPECSRPVDHAEADSARIELL